jgi:hypothetical protein
LIGEFRTCEECAISKAGQKNFAKEWKGGSQIPGERLYKDWKRGSLTVGERLDVDIRSIQGVSFGGAKVLLLVFDDYLGWSYFLNKV